MITNKFPGMYYPASLDYGNGQKTSPVKAFLVGNTLQVYAYVNKEVILVAQMENPQFVKASKMWTVTGEVSGVGEQIWKLTKSSGYCCGHPLNKYRPRRSGT